MSAEEVAKNQKNFRRRRLSVTRTTVAEGSGATDARLVGNGDAAAEAARAKGAAAAKCTVR